MNTSFYKKPALSHNGCIKTDLPLTVVGKASKRKMMELLYPGQLLCVGRIYLKTHNGTVRIR